MAGDWIKMMCNLADDPAVLRIAALTGIEEDLVVGKLHRIWSWADSHCDKGHAPSVTGAWLDRYVGVTGFANAMCEGDGETPWLIINDAGITFPKWERHNGQSAKRRAQQNLRQERSRERRRDKSVTDVTPERDKSVTREEKRREEVQPEPSPTTTEADPIAPGGPNYAGPVMLSSKTGQATPEPEPPSPEAYALANRINDELGRQLPWSPSVVRRLDGYRAALSDDEIMEAVASARQNILDAGAPLLYILGGGKGPGILGSLASKPPEKRSRCPECGEPFGLKAKDTWYRYQITAGGIGLGYRCKCGHSEKSPYYYPEDGRGLREIQERGAQGPTPVGKAMEGVIGGIAGDGQGAPESSG